MTVGAGGAGGASPGAGRSTLRVSPGPVCFLRVYEPLVAFEGAERAQWERILASGAGRDLPGGVARERAASLRALIGPPGSWTGPAGSWTSPPGAWTGLPEIEEEAFVLEVDGVPLICPWRTQLRAWEALCDVRDGLPSVLADTFSSRTAASQAERVLDELHRRHPDLARPPIRSSLWSVPLPWFVLVAAEERIVTLGAGGQAADSQPIRSLRYRTAMSRARRRSARALAGLRRIDQDSALCRGVEDLGRWLEEFHPRSVVELDYGGLVQFIDDDALQADESAGDLAEALVASLEREDFDKTTAYVRVSLRMKALQAVGTAS